jgi:hypothetical protein
MNQKKAINLISSLTGLLLILFIHTSFAQKGTISGEIVDSQSKDKIPFTSIALYQQDYSNAVKGVVSDENGYFELNKIAEGNYNLIVSFMGYNADTLGSIILNQQNTDVKLGPIPLVQSVIKLEGVEVQGVANTVSTDLDRRKYKADDFETAKGGTAVDLLNKLPSVSVGPDGNVSLRGTTQFMVYLNGKPTQLAPSVLLAQISADAIENIEVITVPTAKYDAQGKGGIINVVTKRSGREGLSIAANALVGGAPWGHLEDPLSGYEMNDNRYGGGLNYSYVKNKFTFYGGYYYNMKNVNGDRVGDARILQENGSYYHMVASGERPEWYENYSANYGADYRFSDRSVLSASYNFAKRKEGRSAFYVYNNFYGDVDKNPIPGIPVDNDWIYNPNTDNRYGTFHSANIDYKIKFDDISTLSTSVLYEHSSLRRALDNKNYAYDETTETIGELEKHFRQEDDTPLDGFRISLDYERNLENGDVLSFGLQPQILSQEGSFSYDTFNVESNEWGSYTELENSIDLYRGVYAGYVDYSGNSEKFEFALGLRLEYTDQTLDMSNPNYFNIFDRPAESRYEFNQLNWFPNIHLNWLISEEDGLILAASRRINRPPTKNMAPFLYRRHYEVYAVGDPALEPEYISIIEMTYDKNFRNQNFALTGFYRGTENAVFRVNTVYQEENVLIRSYTNAGNTQSLGAELNSNIIAGKKVKVFLGGSLYNYRVSGDIFGYQEKNQSTNWSLKANANWLASDAFKFTVDFDVKSATVTAQGKNELFYMANAAINYTPQKWDGWSFALRGIDLLASNIQGLNTRAYNSEGVQIFYQEVQYNRYGPIIELGVNYALNVNGKSKKKANRTFGDEQF